MYKTRPDNSAKDILANLNSDNSAKNVQTIQPETSLPIIMSAAVAPTCLCARSKRVARPEATLKQDVTPIPIFFSKLACYKTG